MQTMQSNIQADKKAAKGKDPGGRLLLQRNSTKAAVNENRETLLTNASIRNRPEDSKWTTATMSEELAVCWKFEGYQKTAPPKFTLDESDNC